MTTLPQASPGASVSAAEGSPLNHRASLRERRRRRTERRGHAQRPRGSGGRESTLGTPGRRKLGDKSEGPSAREVAQNHVPGTLGSRLRPCPHSGPGGKRETQLPPTPEGPFRKEGPNKKLRKVGDEPWDPVCAHLAPQRLSGSRSESAHRGLHGIWAPGPAPARPRPTPPRPRPPGVRGTIWPAPCQGPRLEESGNSGLRVAGKRCVRAR